MLAVRGGLMSRQNDNQAELKQLWGGKVPHLTPEQVELSIQLWRKIKRKQQPK